MLNTQIPEDIANNTPYFFMISGFYHIFLSVIAPMLIIDKIGTEIKTKVYFDSILSFLKKSDNSMVCNNIDDSNSTIIELQTNLKMIETYKELKAEGEKESRNSSYSSYFTMEDQSTRGEGGSHLIYLENISIINENNDDNNATLPKPIVVNCGQFEDIISSEKRSNNQLKRQFQEKELEVIRKSQSEVFNNNFLLEQQQNQQPTPISSDRKFFNNNEEVQAPNIIGNAKNEDKEEWLLKDDQIDQLQSFYKDQENKINVVDSVYKNNNPSKLQNNINHGNNSLDSNYYFPEQVLDHFQDDLEAKIMNEEAKEQYRRFKFWYLFWVTSFLYSIQHFYMIYFMATCLLYHSFKIAEALAPLLSLMVISSKVICDIFFESISARMLIIGIHLVYFIISVTFYFGYSNSIFFSGVYIVVFSLCGANSVFYYSLMNKIHGNKLGLIVFSVYAYSYEFSIIFIMIWDVLMSIFGWQYMLLCIGAIGILNICIAISLFDDLK